MTVMLKRFKRKKSSVVHGGFRKLNEAVERRQRRAADYLNQKTAALSRRQTTIGLVLFCVLFGGLSAFTIWHSLGSPSRIVSAAQVSIPRHMIIRDTNINQDVVLTDQELRDIRWFRHYLDSLQWSAKGRAIYDSIARYRPGLLDSLAFIEQQYHEQIKTSEDGKTK